jgi:hypothetical protein
MSGKKYSGKEFPKELLQKEMRKYTDEDGNLSELDIYNAISDVEKQIDDVYLIDIVFPNGHFRKFVFPKL